VKKNLLQIVRPRAKYATEVVQLPPTMAQKRIIAKNAKKLISRQSHWCSWPNIFILSEKNSNLR